MMNRLRGVLFNNFSLKLISLALASLLFIAVRSEKDSLAQGSVKLAMTPPPGRMLAEEPPSSLRITVSGPTSRMQHFRFEDLADVSIDLSGISEGFFKFNEDLVKLPAGLRVTAIRPSGFRVRYEPLTIRILPVKVVLQGQVAAGFQVAGHSVKPATVEVRGPKSAVLPLAQVRLRPVSVDKADNTLVLRASLMPMANEVTARPANGLEVTVRIVPLTSEVVLSGVPLILNDPLGQGARSKTTKVNVKISGPPQVLANLTRDRVVAAVDCEPVGVGQSRLKPFIRGLPAGVKVLSITPPTVKVTRDNKAAADKPPGSVLPEKR